MYPANNEVARPTRYSGAPSLKCCLTEGADSTSAPTAIGGGEKFFFFYTSISSVSNAANPLCAGF